MIFYLNLSQKYHFSAHFSRFFVKTWNLKSSIRISGGRFRILPKSFLKLFRCCVNTWNGTICGTITASCGRELFVDMQLLFSFLISVSEESHFCEFEIGTINFRVAIVMAPLIWRKFVAILAITRPPSRCETTLAKYCSCAEKIILLGLHKCWSKDQEATTFLAPFWRH